MFLLGLEKGCVLQEINCAVVLKQLIFLGSEILDFALGWCGKDLATRDELRGSMMLDEARFYMSPPRKCKLACTESGTVTKDPSYPEGIRRSLK